VLRIAPAPPTDAGGGAAQVTSAEFARRSPESPSDGGEQHKARARIKFPTWARKPSGVVA
jgi:hypothetical protein